MAVRGPDPHNLRRMAQQAAVNTAPVIDSDRECNGCGYNLRGLRVGSICPECGTPSTRAPADDDPLSLMPTRVIIAFIRGCWVASACVLALIALIAVGSMQFWPWKFSVVGIAGVSILWTLAVMWLTPAFRMPQAVSRGFGPRGRRRLAARHLQWGWVVVAGTLVINEFLSPAARAQSVLGIAVIVGLSAGIIGIVVLCLVLERLADWARDVDAERMFNWTAWALPLAMLASLVNLSSMPTLSMVLRILAGVLWLVAVFAFPYGLFQLSRSVTLSILHSFEHRQRMVRREERQERFHQEVADAVRKIDGPGGGGRQQARGNRQ